MDPNAINVADECSRLSDANAATFPQVVARLGAAGIERYHADLQRGEKTYYMPDGASHRSRCAAVTGAFARDFSPHGVSDAVRAIQRGAIDYAAFCERIAGAGCTGYLVSLSGRRAVYYGRSGETCVEYFPGS